MSIIFLYCDFSWVGGCFLGFWGGMFVGIGLVLLLHADSVIDMITVSKIADSFFNFLPPDFFSNNLF